MDKNRSRLGRGLSSLMSVDAIAEPVIDDPNSPPNPLPTTVVTEVMAGETMFHVELDRVAANPRQPRRIFDQASLELLAASLKSSGLIQPIVVRRMGINFELVAGERRLRAARLAGLATLPAIVRAVDDIQQAQLALIENIHREDLNPIDRASAYRQLMEQLGLTQEELAIRLSEDRSGIANFLRLLELSQSAREALTGGKISMGHAKILAGMRDVNEQDRLVNLIITQELSVRNLERLVANQPEIPKKPPARTSSAHVVDLEKRLSRALEMRVEVRQGKKGGRGRLVIHYASLDQFDELLARLKFELE